MLDRADGSPISDVSVRIENAGAPIATDAAGRFELTGVTPGRHVLYVSVIGFILVRRPIDVVDGVPLDLTIVLSEGTGTYTETVEVAGERFREQEKSVPSQMTLGSADIQNLRNLLTNDPMRAIQVLPGVTTGDDFHSEFAVRGSPFPRMNFTFDGIPTALLLHTVPQVQDGGSIAMLNGDILDGISLLNGSYPQRYGNRLGAELDFHMREGSRNRTQMRVGVSGTDASVVVEGPLGRAKAGSWLVSLRKSYLELLLKQVSDENDDFGFGFSDVQSKLTYDLSPRHRFELSLVAGRSRLDDSSASPDDVNVVADGRNRAGVVNAAWRFAVSPRLVVTERIAAGAQVFRNTNAAGVELGSGAAREITWRTDFVATPRPSVTVEGGGQIQSHHRDESALVFPGGPAPVVLTDYDDGAHLASAYGQARWTRSARASATAGARVDHWSLTGEAEVSPWLQGDLQLPAGLKLRGGTGIYRQFPGIPEVTGTHGNDAVRTERAYHADVGIEQSLGSSARWQFTLYNREERDVLRLPASELRVVDGALLGISLGAPWANTLTGHARGAELLVQRRSNTGLTGWLSYSVRGEPLPRRRDRRDVRWRFRSAAHPECLRSLPVVQPVQPDGEAPAGEQHAGDRVLGAARRSAVRRLDAERPASAAVFTARRPCEPHLQLGKPAPDAVRRSDERAEPGQRALRNAWCERPHVPGLRHVRHDDSADSVGGDSDRVLSGWSVTGSQ